MSGDVFQRVTQPHQRSYEDPITLSAGERVRTGERDLWDGIHEWVWCVSSNDKAGWVPATYLQIHGDEAVVLHDYSAMELTVAVGEAINILLEESGWYWCQNTDGIKGWVPTTCFD